MNAIRATQINDVSLVQASRKVIIKKSPETFKDLTNV